MQVLAFQNVDKLWIELNRAMQGLLESMPGLIPIAQRKDLLGKAFSFLIGGARVITGVPVVLGIQYNIGVQLRFLKIEATPDRDVTVVPNIDINQPPSNQGGDMSQEEILDVPPSQGKTIEIDDQGNIRNLDESYIRSLIREIISKTMLENHDDVASLDLAADAAQGKFDYTNPEAYEKQLLKVGRDLGGETGETAAKIGKNIGIGIA